MDIVWKGVIGGLLTALIALASKRGNTLPGILPLFPTFAVIALAVVGAKGSADGFREACLAGVKAMPAYLAFLAACWVLSDWLDYRWAIACGLAAWLLVASAVFLLPRLWA